MDAVWFRIKLAIDNAAKEDQRIEIGKISRGKMGMDRSSFKTIENWIDCLKRGHVQDSSAKEVFSWVWGDQFVVWWL